MPRLSRSLFFLMFLALAGAERAAHAQPTGSLAGRVLDEASSALPGVTVEVRSLMVPSGRVAVTDNSGNYALQALPHGTYQVSFQLLNFAKVARRGIEVGPGGTVRLDATLPLAVNADVVVTGSRTFRNLAEVTETEGLIGVAGAATQGVQTAAQIQTQPIQRAGDLLETIPGVVISQHSGEGKANQYYLRGFNLDHGTDFATTVAGVPVNMPTHGHGHGYTDLSFLIPELVSGIQYKKGPYFAEDGDFSAAGSANINYVNVLDQTIAKVGGGENGFGRALFASSPRLGSGYLLAALEVSRNDGPWVHPDNYEKFNGILRYSLAAPESSFSVTAMGYQADWSSTDQIPNRAIENDTIDRFGAIDPSDAGETHRYSLAAEWQRQGDRSVTRATAYGIDYKLNLFSNFTYFLDDPLNGDQFEQADRRFVAGLRGTHRWLMEIGGLGTENLVGVQVRHDDIRNVALYSTRARRRLATTREDEVGQTSGALFFQTDIQWSSRLRTILGVRGDTYRFDVTSDDPANSGEETDEILSPKFSAILGPWGRTELYANAGYGFHSNDARGATITRDPKTGDPAERVTPLVKAKAAELGVRTFPVSRWQTTVAAWVLELDSELIFVGDAGTTEAGRPSRRSGIEWSNYFKPTSWLTIEAEASVSRARFRDSDPAGDRIPGAVEQVYTLSAAVDDMRGFFGGVHVRYFGQRPLIEDDSVRSEASVLVSAQLGYEIFRGLKASLNVFNVFDAEESDVDYFYASRLTGEPDSGVDDIHTHPVEPRSVRIAVAYAF